MLNQLLQDKLATLAEDDYLIKALKELFQERIEKNKPVVDKSDDDIILGQKYRAYEYVKQIVDIVLTIDIPSYKKESKLEDGFDKSK